MIMINIHEAKAKLSEYLARVAAGGSVVICKHNRPVAELRPVAEVRTTPRPFGLGAGTFEVPDSFFEPLPDADIDLFYGVAPAGTARTMRVAEPGTAYGPQAPAAGASAPAKTGRSRPVRKARRS